MFIEYLRVSSWIITIFLWYNTFYLSRDVSALILPEMQNLHLSAHVVFHSVSDTVDMSLLNGN